jgi:hypothetical protein
VAHEGDAFERVPIARGHRPFTRRGDHADLAAGGHLTVHARMAAGDVLAGVAVEVAHDLGERLDRGVEGAIRAPVAALTELAVTDHEAVEAAPEVVEALDEVVQSPALREQSFAAGHGAGDALQRVAGEQPQEVHEVGAASGVGGVDRDLRERRRLVRPQVGHEETDDALEGGALDELARGRAHLAIGVHDDRALVDVKAPQ